MASQLPRFTLNLGKPVDMVANYPRIVGMAQAQEYVDGVIREARQVPLSGGQRVEFVRGRLDRLGPEHRQHAWQEVERRKVLSR